MKLKELISAISQESGVPAGQVRKVASALTAKIKECIEEQQGFRSGDVMFKPVTVAAKSNENGETTKPQRQLARVMIRPRKPKGERKKSQKTSENDN